MNDEQTSQRSRHWLTWVIACLVLLSLLIVLTTPAPAHRRGTVTIDTNGTVYRLLAPGEFNLTKATLAELHTKRMLA